ncbi:Uncharacterized protein dnm_057870 [Desulfonema magnum]|uniref:Uncharacterized protein n=1 Tax=Desulfonema magnum TaxID=45655 RepID=A0A975GQB5_9BACT|nr:Uncharacterized protein dnm_057870 [Desulfonema magnum]
MSGKTEKFSSFVMAGRSWPFIYLVLVKTQFEQMKQKIIQICKITRFANL